MTISVIHPSRGRPEIARQTAEKWIKRADNGFEYILSLDSDSLEGYSWIKDVFVIRTRNSVTNIGHAIFTENKSAVEAINYAAKNADADLLIVISDDFDCPEHWDTLLLEEVKGCKDFLLKTQDGLQKTLITLPIMDRTYYNRFGYIYHPDYLHMHADEEMTIVGHMLGRVITSDLLFEHKHYSTGKSAKDEVNVKNNATWSHGAWTLERRAKYNFDIEHPLVKREDIVWK